MSLAGGEPVQRPGVAPQGGADEAEETRSALLFGVAGSLEEILRAWRLVYVAYQRIGLIDRNEFELHTSRQAASSQSAVITGRIREQTAATLTAMRDGELRLPLDAVYGEELDALRARGRRLTEVGLFADRREDMGRSLGALLGLMRFAFHYASQDETSTIVIGVHPHHVRFYERLFGFEPAGETRTYAAVKDHLVVLLRLDIPEKARTSPLPRGLTFFIQDPVPPLAFESRFHFGAELLSTPPLSGYFAYRSGGRPGPGPPA
jgi:hypothetical protein